MNFHFARNLDIRLAGAMQFSSFWRAATTIHGLAPYGGIMDSSVLERQQAVVKEFEGCSDWEERYAKIIKMGKALEGLSEADQIDDLLVKGCQSRVWLKAAFENGKVQFKADSDAVIVRGLVAMLLKVYSNLEPQAILSSPPKFIEELGLSEHLSANRTNGLASMYKQIHFYAIAFSQMS